MKRTMMFRPFSLLLAGTLGLALPGPVALAQDLKPSPNPVAEDPTVRPSRRSKPAPVQENPSEPKPRAVQLFDAGGAAKDKINKKLESIVFPRVEFREATVREAIEFIVKKAKELDPENEGVNIVLKLPEAPLATPPRPPKALPGLPAAEPLPLPDAVPGDVRITLSLNNVPLLEVLKYITSLANLRYKIDPFAVTIVPLVAEAPDLQLREWKVPARLFQAQAEAPAAGLPGTSLDPNAPPKIRSAKDFLIERGVLFGPGALAIYSRANSTLVVKNSEEQLDLVQRIVEGASSVDETGAPLLPRVEFKEATISETVEFLMARVPDANILIQSNIRNIPVTVNLRNVTLAQALDAMQFTTGGQIVVQQAGENVFQISRNPQAANDTERAQVRIFSLAGYLGQKDEQAQAEAISRFEDTLRNAVDMLRAADPGADAQTPRLQMNPSTRLLVAVGRKSDLAIVEQLVAAVEGKVVAVPERVGSGGGVSKPGRTPYSNQTGTPPLPSVVPPPPAPQPRSNNIQPPSPAPGASLPQAPGLPPGTSSPLSALPIVSRLFELPVASPSK